MPTGPDRKLQLILGFIALICASWMSSSQAASAPPPPVAPAHPDVYAAAKGVRFLMAPSHRLTQPTAGTLVTATPLALNGTWEGTNAKVEISFRVNGRGIEAVSIVYKYGDSFACSIDPAYLDIQVRSSDSGLVLPLEGTSFQGVVAASYDAGGVPAEGNFRIEGTFESASSATGTISFVPAAGPPIPGSINCLEERPGISWSATRVATPTLTPTVTPTSSPTTLVAPTSIVTPTNSASSALPTPTPNSTGTNGSNFPIWVIILMIGAVALVIVVRSFPWVKPPPLPWHQGMLTARQKKELCKVLGSAFTIGELKRMLKHDLNRELDDISTKTDYRAIRFDLVETAERENWIHDLIRAAREANPRNLDLQSFAQSVGAEIADAKEQ